MNLVEIPTAFRTLSGDDTSTNCLPNIWVPTANATSTFVNNATSASSGSVLNCFQAENITSGSSVDQFKVSCVTSGDASRGDCYNLDACGSADKRYFKTYRIYGDVTCFPFVGNEAYKYAAEPQEDYETWVTAQTAANAKGLWYMCNRIFAWSMM